MITALRCLHTFSIVEKFDFKIVETQSLAGVQKCKGRVRMSFSKYIFHRQPARPESVGRIVFYINTQHHSNILGNSHLFDFFLSFFHVVPECSEGCHRVTIDGPMFYAFLARNEPKKKKK